MKIETSYFSIEGQIKSMCQNSLQRGVIDENSLMGECIKKTFPNQSITEALENILHPEYMNSTFTWLQLEKALKQIKF
jgi:hypothetical protein